jgi:hypothetical protein
MSNTLSFPFRLTPNGFAVTVPQRSEEYYVEQIAVILTTEPGERVLVPGLGVANMPFNGFSKPMMDQQLSTFLPEIRLNEVEVKNLSDAVQEVTISFDSGGGA